MASNMTIAIIGGTGELGAGLAKRWAKAGHNVVLGSRTAEKAASAASEIAAAVGMNVKGADNLAAAQSGDIVVIAVPWSNHDAILTEIADAVKSKIVIDAAVPLVPPKVGTVQLPQDGTASQRAQRLLPGSKIVGAFHNVGAKKLMGDDDIDCDILVCGDDKEAREKVMALAKDAGMRGIDAGPLANSVASEALTSILIGINRRYKISSAGIRITGIPEE